MKIHIIGIGGIGTSALASILLRQGRTVSGCDQKESVITQQLQTDGITIVTGDSDTLPSGTSEVIYSLAVPKDHLQLKEAQKKNIPIFSYPEAVGKLTQELFTIAISGTHGKSTITSMVSKVLIDNLFDPSVIVGTLLKELDGRNFRFGKSKMLVLESCEYMRAFLNYSPRIILLNTLDPDHLDYYKDFKDYISAFDEFIERLPRDGYFLANLDDEDVHHVLRRLQERHFPQYNVFTYSSKYPSSTFYLDGKSVYREGKNIGEFQLLVPGVHNRMNALGAFAVCSVLGVAPNAIIASLDAYAGAYRRFEMKGKIGNTVIIDDYGHHPVEIRATLQAAREKFGKGHVCVVFQPHQYNRTKKLFNEFSQAFTDANTVIISDIYKVRDSEKDVTSVTAESLVSAIKKNHPKGTIIYGDGMANTLQYLKKNHKKFDAILTMGAGDITDLANDLVN